MAIFIEIKPSHSRSQRTELLGQQRLARIIPEHLLLMSMAEQRADIAEQRGAWFPRFHVGYSGRTGFFDFIKPVGLYVREH